MRRERIEQPSKQVRLISAENVYLSTLVGSFEREI